MIISIIPPCPRFSKEIKLKRHFNQELVDTTGAGLSVACAHLVNRHLCKTCPACEPEGV